jgi:hypothetical protein
MGCCPLLGVFQGSRRLKSLMLELCEPGMPRPLAALLLELLWALVVCAAAAAVLCWRRPNSEAGRLCGSCVPCAHAHTHTLKPRG